MLAAAAGVARAGEAVPPEGPAKAEEPAAAIVEVSYDRGLRLRAPDGTLDLRVKAVLQPEARLFSVPAEAGRELEAAFLVRRARLVLEGTALLPTLGFKLQLGLDRAEPALRDAYVEYALAPGVLHLRAGKYKRPFSRQQIASGTELAFVERSFTNALYEAGRDVGVMASNDYERAPRLEWALGVFNGFEEVPGVPRLFKPSVVGRIGYNSADYEAYDEVDLEGGALRYSFAGSARLDLDVDGGQDARLLTQLDGVLKLYGVSALAALYLTTSQADLRIPAPGGPSLGLHAQMSYVLQDVLGAADIGPSARYSFAAPFFGAPRLHEGVAGCNVFILDHALKWQSDVFVVVDEGLGAAAFDVGARTQLTMVF